MYIVFFFNVFWWFNMICVKWWCFISDCRILIFVDKWFDLEFFIACAFGVGSLSLLYKTSAICCAFVKLMLILMYFWVLCLSFLMWWFVVCFCLFVCVWLNLILWCWSTSRAIAILVLTFRASGVLFRGMNESVVVKLDWKYLSVLFYDVFLYVFVFVMFLL